MHIFQNTARCDEPAGLSRQCGSSHSLTLFVHSLPPPTLKKGVFVPMTPPSRPNESVFYFTSIEFFYNFTIFLLTSKFNLSMYAIVQGYFCDIIRILPCSITKPSRNSHDYCNLWRKRRNGSYPPGEW